MLLCTSKLEIEIKQKYHLQYNKKSRLLRDKANEMCVRDMYWKVQTTDERNQRRHKS